MKTRLLCIAVLSAISFASNAQNAESTKSSNAILFSGHVIRIYKTAPAGYGYDIFYRGNLVIHKQNNPFTGSHGGLKNKDDALKVAKWQTLQVNPVNHQVIRSSENVPIEVARQLNIAVN